MAFVVKYRGLDVTVDSLDQLDQLADRISPNGAGRKSNEVPQAHGANTEDRTQKLRKMIAGIVGNQRQFLVLLSTYAKQTDTELREKLNLDSNKALAGVMAGISKAIKRNGLQLRIVDKTSFRSSSGDREYTYSLNPAVKEDIRESLETRSRV